MRSYNIHDAKTNLSRLIEEAVSCGEPFIIAKAGKPQVTVTPYKAQAPTPPCRIGFLKGAIKVPADFDTMGADEIAGLFEGGAS